MLIGKLKLSEENPALECNEITCSLYKHWTLLMSLVRDSQVCPGPPSRVRHPNGTSCPPPLCVFSTARHSSVIRPRPPRSLLTAFGARQSSALELPLFSQSASAHSTALCSSALDSHSCTSWLLLLYVPRLVLMPVLPLLLSVTVGAVSSSDIATMMDLCLPQC